MENLFIGRENELTAFKNLLNKKGSSLVVIKGRRRVGKSRIIKEFAKNNTHLKFVGLAPSPEITAQHQREEFAKQLSEYFNIGSIIADDWRTLFNLLASFTANGRYIVSFDEISWMAHGDETFLGQLKTLWDERFSLNPKLILILCGSVSSWIEQNILLGTGFLGRISWSFTLPELPLNHAYTLMKKKGFHGSSFEAFQLLAITGGIPWYLEQIQSRDTATSFVQKQCFSPGGILVNEFNQVFHDLYKNRNAIYRQIVGALVEGPLEFESIRNKLGYAKSGRLSDYLNHLVEAGFISRYFAWNFTTGKKRNISRFHLTDNYIRFFLKYIEPKMDHILEGRLMNCNPFHLTGWPGIMGFQIENLVLKNRNALINALNIKPEDIVTDSSYYQRATKTKRGCQIDYLIQTRFKTLYVFEIKSTSTEVKPKVIKEVQQKIKDISLPRGYNCIPILIHVGDVAESVRAAEFFAAIIDFSDHLVD